MNAFTNLKAIETHAVGAVEVIRVEANLGADVRGIDLAAPIAEPTAALLRSLLWEHQVLFFRDTGVDNKQQAAIGRVFGPPVADSIAKRRGVKDEDIQPMNTGPYANAYYGTPWHADAT